ncbi:MAG: hypothetical protein P4L10_15805 [Acidobacteriaceae bacterium]|nr:hypothetical protein [Acidobacteriaceae bacterium]
MSRDPSSVQLRLRRAYPPPPRLHWFVLLVAVVGAEALVSLFVHSPYRELLFNLIIAVWPIYICVWLRKIDPRSSALYWAIASLATGFLFAWLLWIVVVFEVREDLLDHYNRREPIGLRLHIIPTILFSFVYFQYHLRRIARQKIACVPSAVALPADAILSD